MSLRITFFIIGGLLATETVVHAQPSVARQWNELLLDAIRVDTPRPTVHARNLFHTSAAMYDSWASYDPLARGYFSQEKLAAADIEASRAETVSFAAYGILKHRFAHSPGAATSLASFDAKMDELGYDRTFTSTLGDSPAALGNRIAAAVLQVGMVDGSNEGSNYADTTGYLSANPPLDVSLPGTVLHDYNSWQPLIIGGKTQQFLTPHWGNVTMFRHSGESLPPVDAGTPPLLGGPKEADFKSAVVDVIRYSSYLDGTDGTLIDISPAVVGNNPLGTNNGSGHAVNPFTGQPYEPNVVRRSDYGRVLAEFWADGPHSETPPGHWNAIFNEVSDSPLLEKRIGGSGDLVDDLEWDVKGYFALNGAVHNAAIVSWENKKYYDYVRPISMIRYMAGRGQATDSTLPSYDPYGLPLIPGLIELVGPDTTAPGQRHEHLAGHEGEIAIFAWKGHPDQATQIGGVDWILGESWMPYQADDFVTPAFPGFTSGHSTFSRAAAEVLTALTGDEYFPGGLGVYSFDADNFLRFESGPTQDLTLEWATYFDAADEAGLSRLYGGIHVAADDFLGRITGSQVGVEAFQVAHDHFVGVPEPNASLLALIAAASLVHLRRRMRTTRIGNVFFG